MTSPHQNRTKADGSTAIGSVANEQMLVFTELVTPLCAAFGDGVEVGGVLADTGSVFVGLADSDTEDGGLPKCNKV